MIKIKGKIFKKSLTKYLVVMFHYLKNDITTKPFVTV